MKVEIKRIFCANNIPIEEAGVSNGQATFIQGETI